MVRFLTDFLETMCNVCCNNASVKTNLCYNYLDSSITLSIWTMVIQIESKELAGIIFGKNKMASLYMPSIKILEMGRIILSVVWISRRLVIPCKCPWYHDIASVMPQRWVTQETHATQIGNRIVVKFRMPQLSCIMGLS